MSQSFQSEERVLPGVVDVSGRSILLMEGPDAKDLLQRISTNDINKLTDDHCVQTVFTNEKG